jgi:RsiW-degrading membrane proteinase PrsW (M82 family)
MDSDQDPIERAADEEADLHAVTTWEARSLLDHVACAIYRHGEWLLAGFGVLIVYYLFTFRTLGTITDPRVALLVVLSVVPTVALAAYVRFANVTTGEPLSVLFVTFLLGILLAGFAIPLNAFSRVVFVRTVPIEFLGLVLFYLLIVGPFEELVKLLAVGLFAFNHPRFDAVIDGAVYGAVAGLGFATIENALYITDALSVAGPFQQADTPSAVLELGGGITVSRALAGPGHVLYSSIAGYYLGLAKFNRGSAGPIVIKGLLVAALAHGVYNTGANAIPELLGVAFGLSTFTALTIYVVGFNSVVGAYLYTKLKRYRDTYTAVNAGETAGSSAEATPERATPVGSDLQSIDRRANAVRSYPGTDGTAVFAHRHQGASHSGNTRAENEPANRVEVREKHSIVSLTDTERSSSPDEHSDTVEQPPAVQPGHVEEDWTADRSTTRSKPAGEES